MRVLRYTDFTHDELTRLCWLRAVEWLAWPAFLSQPLLPILYVYYPVLYPLTATVIASSVWLLIRYKFMSLELADFGCLWVRLKWITIPIGCLLLLRQGRYVAASLAVATPWLAGVMTLPIALITPLLGLRGSLVGVVQEDFMAQAGVFQESVSSAA